MIYPGQSVRSVRSWNIRAAWGLSLVGLAAMLISGCGDDRMDADDELEDAATCTAPWQPLTSALPWDFVSPLAYRDGQIYYATNSTRTLNSLAVAGGVPRVIADGYTRELWLEDDHVIYTDGDDGLQLLSVPIAGGAPSCCSMRPPGGQLGEYRCCTP